ncbi:MAG: glycosyltransferase, partial [Planctomycetes bacterium]|nr:glycosyltransferase [Planctomycetota bacterium]
MTTSEPAPKLAPRLVVVIPALNEEASLGLVLKGIATAQTDPAPIAVIVGDNGSTDGT